MNPTIVVKYGSFGVYSLLSPERPYLCRKGLGESKLNLQIRSRMDFHIGANCGEGLSPHMSGAGNVTPESFCVNKVSS